MENVDQKTNSIRKRTKPLEKQSKYLRAKHIAYRYEVSRSHVDIMVDRGVIPPPITLDGKIRVWPRRVIEALDNRRDAKYLEKIIEAGFDVPQELQDSKLAGYSR